MLLEDIKLFLTLAKKKFFRTPYWERNLVVKILLAFVVLYFTAAFLLLGIGIYFILSEEFPEQRPVNILNQFLAYYFLIELAIRYFFQKLPVTQIQHFITLPLKKKKIVRWSMLQSLVSFFNSLPFLVFLPFTIISTVKGDEGLSIWVWWLAIVALTFTFSYLVLLVNKSNRFLFTTLAIVGTCLALERWFDITTLSYFGKGLDLIVDTPLLIVIPIGLFVLTLYQTARFLNQQFYLDKGLSKQSERVIGSQLGVFDKFGVIGTFLKNDIRLIIRNIRPRQVVLVGVLFLFYGLIFYTQDIYRESNIMIVFASVIISGGFMITFGQYVPAWDSEYYSFLMGQNISYKKYIESKWYLMVFSVIVSAILATPYLYFGWDILKIILATAVFNLGVVSYVTLISGALNRNPLKLNVKAKAFENTQAINFTQILLSLPKMGLPILVFYVPSHFFGFDVGIYSMVVVGILGLLLRNPILNGIESLYQKGKYKTLAAFNKKA